VLDSVAAPVIAAVPATFRFVPTNALFATAKPPLITTPVEAVDDVASPLAENVATPVTPSVVPTYSAFAIAAPPPTTMPPLTVEDDASPLAENVATPVTPSVLWSVDAPVTPSVLDSVAAPVIAAVPATFRFVPTYTLFAIAAPPLITTPVEAVDDVASPLAENVATPVTPSVLDSVAAPVTPSVLDSVAAPVTPSVLDSVAAPVIAAVPATFKFVPTYTLFAIAAPPLITTPVEAVDDVASPLAENVATPVTPSVLDSVAAPVIWAVPPTFRFVPTLAVVPTYSACSHQITNKNVTGVRNEHSHNTILITANETCEINN
jgi:hypothetical protein